MRPPSHVAELAAVDLGATSGRGDAGPRRRWATAHRGGEPVLERTTPDLGRTPHGVALGCTRPVRTRPRWSGPSGTAGNGPGRDRNRFVGCRLRPAARRTTPGSPLSLSGRRNHAGVSAVHQAIDPAVLYSRNGLQFLPFNTIYQLMAEKEAGTLDLADRALLIPDLLGYWLTGAVATERTAPRRPGSSAPMTAGTPTWNGRWACRPGCSPT